MRELFEKFEVERDYFCDSPKDVRKIAQNFLIKNGRYKVLKVEPSGINVNITHVRQFEGSREPKIFGIDANIIQVRIISIGSVEKVESTDQPLLMQSDQQIVVVAESQTTNGHRHFDTFFINPQGINHYQIDINKDDKNKLQNFDPYMAVPGPATPKKVELIERIMSSLDTFAPTVKN